MYSLALQYFRAFVLFSSSSVSRAIIAIMSEIAQSVLLLVTDMLLSLG